MITSRTYHSLNLDIAPFDSSNIIYVLLPHRLPEEDLASIEEMSSRFESTIVVISEMDWNSDLTPWKAPAVKEGEFGGHASQFLDRLKEDLFFNLENSLQIRKPRGILLVYPLQDSLQYGQPSGSRCLKVFHPSLDHSGMMDSPNGS